MILPALLMAAALSYVIPPKYIKPYTGELHVFIVSKEQVWRNCKGPAEACAIRGTSFKDDRPACVIFIRKDSRVSRKTLMQHELAHCNGWGRSGNEHPRN